MTIQHFYLMLSFLFGFLLIFGVNMIVADIVRERRQDTRRRLDEELKLRSRDRAKTAMQDKDLYEIASQGALDLSKHETVAEKLRNLVNQSGASITASQLVLSTIGFGVVATAMAWFIVPNVALSLTMGLLGASLPFLYVHVLRIRRKNKLMSQLPDAFELMSRILRSGQTMSQSLQAVADEFPRPISEEFGYCYEQQNLGLSTEAAMRDLANRAGLLEVRIFIVAVMVHRQAGGNLSELLDKIATVIRTRFRIRGQIKAVTAEGRMQAVILLALPPMMLVLLLIVNRPYMITIFQYPWLLIGMFICEVLGAIWMHRIVNFDF